MSVKNNFKSVVILFQLVSFKIKASSDCSVKKNKMIVEPSMLVKILTTFSFNTFFNRFISWCGRYNRDFVFIVSEFMQEFTSKYTIVINNLKF